MINKKIRSRVLIYLIMVVVLSFLPIDEYINLDIFYNTKGIDNGTLFNIVTVNAVLIGFLFSSIALFYSFNNTETFKISNILGTSDNVFINMFSGIYFGLISTAVILIFTFIKVENVQIIKLGMMATIVSLIYSFVFLFFAINGIVSFFKDEFTKRDIEHKVKKDAAKKYIEETDASLNE